MSLLGPLQFFEDLGNDVDFATQQLDLLAQFLDLLFLLVIVVLVFIIVPIVPIVFLVIVVFHGVMMFGMPLVGVRAKVLHPRRQARMLARHDHVDNVRLRMRRHVLRSESSVVRPRHEVRPFARVMHAFVRIKEAASVKGMHAFVRMMKVCALRAVRRTMFAMFAPLLVASLTALAATTVFAVTAMLLGLLMMMRVMVLDFIFLVFMALFMPASMAAVVHAFVMAPGFARSRVFPLMRRLIIIFRLLVSQGESILTSLGVLARLAFDMAVHRLKEGALQPRQPQSLRWIVIRPSAGCLKQSCRKARQEQVSHESVSLSLDEQTTKPGDHRLRPGILRAPAPQTMLSRLFPKKPGVARRCPVPLWHATRMPWPGSSLESREKCARYSDYRSRRLCGAAVRSQASSTASEVVSEGRKRQMGRHKRGRERSSMRLVALRRYCIAHEKTAARVHPVRRFDSVS